MSSNERIRKLCRICGDVGSVNIFGSLGQSLDLSEKINTLLPINVSLNDRFSTMVCVACVNQITTLNDIVGMSTCTNELMLKLLEKEDCTFRERMLKLCRICGNHGLLDIYNQCNENSVSLADKINSCLSLQVSPEDQLSLKLCQSCANRVENVYPIIEFSRNTTKIMSMITGNITLDDSMIEVASPEVIETLQAGIKLDANEMILENNNKENELDNLYVEEHNINNVMNILLTQNTYANSTQIQCLRCTDTFTSGTHLRRHILLNHTLKELDCHHCFRRCSNELEFENHVKLHLLSEHLYYPCDLCLNYFKSLASLIRHIKTHSGLRIKDWALSYNLRDRTTLYGCRYCNKTFILETSRQIHERIHFRCLICETCGKQLPNKSQLSVHQRQHTGERPYECTNCGSKFKCLSTLRQHEVIHSEKKYSCEVCLRKFSRPEKVRIHMRVHTGEKPYNCLMCHKKYQQKNDLNRHMKKQHEQQKMDINKHIKKHCEHEQHYTMNNLR